MSGKLVPDEPAELPPEGTVVDLAVLDEGDDLDDDERTELDAAIAESRANLRAGAKIPADDVLRELDELG